MHYEQDTTICIMCRICSSWRPSAALPSLHHRDHLLRGKVRDSLYMLRRCHTSLVRAQLF